MRLHDLLEQVPHLAVRGPTDRSIRHLSDDSREITPESVFVAIRGLRVDGHRFVPGLRAAAVVVEEEVEAAEGVTVVRVADSHLALAQLAAAFHGDPSQELDVIGVTGTNGKTTTCAMLEAIFTGVGARVGVIGTTGNRVAGEPIPGRFTTPIAIEWQGLLARMRDAGCAVVAAEVSSIGLAARRVDATRFPVAVWTNLSQDHLDFHGDMERYREAKARLFTELLSLDGVAVLPAEEPALALLAGLPEGATRWTFGRGAGDIRAEDLRSDLQGSRFRLVTPTGSAPVDLRLVGAFNVLNALAAAGAALALGVPVGRIAEGLGALRAVPGRLEPVDRGQGFGVLVDYAHTPDALRVVLETLRPLTPGRILTVFGCGGDRDREKRPLMARAVSEGSDLAIATSDNPRSEDPLAILEDMRPGLRPDAWVEPDRAVAIRLALSEARAGDLVLIAGKGHEATQEIAGVKHPFDDRVVAAAALEARA
ncbi:MAG: UDP-N-acetylmuramoyl-L-alanyl-D-glutamate--2,6-diaminopimelate ligase [Alphaproteobacteria bacterium]|nr:UDP-N-acetylmuramoyl-L-alanyl-D-glutamate--2,6-diaminopimelate ligase [Alphaproteobacteria bacterium]